MMKRLFLPTYYGGFDPGSGRAGLYLEPGDGIDLEQNLLTIDSLIAIGNVAKLLQRGDTHATVADVLREGECLIQWNDTAYYLLDLLKEGKNVNDALGDPNRYWSDHARILLLALASMLIPERSFVLRLVTALPVTLYSKENRQRMKESLTGYYRFEFNGRMREAYVTIGYVAMEGQGILIHCGDQEGEQAVLDIGERTVDALAADGQKLLTSLCDGNEDLGIGQITDGLRALTQRYGRVLPTAKLHDLLWAWSHQQPLPAIRASSGYIPEKEIVATIETTRRSLAKGIYSFASSLWNVEGEAVGERFEQLLLAGGGAHYVGDLLAEMFPRAVVPANPEDGNIKGYCDLALTLEGRVPGIWEID